MLDLETIGTTDRSLLRVGRYSQYSVGRCLSYERLAIFKLTMKRKQHVSFTKHARGSKKTNKTDRKIQNICVKLIGSYSNYLNNSSNPLFKPTVTYRLYLATPSIVRVANIENQNNTKRLKQIKLHQRKD